MGFPFSKSNLRQRCIASTVCLPCNLNFCLTLAWPLWLYHLPFWWTPFNVPITLIKLNAGCSPASGFFHGLQLWLCCFHLFLSFQLCFSGYDACLVCVLLKVICSTFANDISFKTLAFVCEFFFCLFRKRILSPSNIFA